MRNISVVVGCCEVCVVVDGKPAEELAGMPAFEVVPVTTEEEDAPNDILGSFLVPCVSYVRGPGGIDTPVISTSSSLSDVYDDDDIFLGLPNDILG